MSRILAVDDNVYILEILKYILEDSGYEVDTLTDGHFLLEKIHEHHPDLIILDIMLGNMDGRELCKIVKRRKETHDIPVIMISATHSVGDMSLNDQPNDFLMKPFDVITLLNSVARQLAA